MSKFLKPVFVASLLTVSALALTGCEGVLYSKYHNTPSSGGTALEDVVEAWEATPGVVSFEYETEPWYNPGEGGLFSSEGVDLVSEVVFDEGYHIEDPEEFLATYAETVWNINGGFSPEGNVQLTVVNGIDPNYNWHGVAMDLLATSREDRGINVQRIMNEETGVYEVTLSLVDERLEKTFGKWADEDEVVTPNLASGSPELMKAPAFYAPRSNGTATTGSKTCYGWTAKRGGDVHSDEPYDGEIETVVFYGDKELTRMTTDKLDTEWFDKYRPSSSHEYKLVADNVCFNEKINPKKLVFKITAPAYGNFEGTTAEVRY